MMEHIKIFEITDHYRLFVGNSLEEYRCETFFTKEPETVEWINTYIKNGDTFYDVGANVGVYSIYAAILHPNMTVYSFEPYLKNFERLCDNIHLNNVVNIIPLYIALSNIAGIEKFFIRDERVGASGNQISESKDEKGRCFSPVKEYYVPTLSLDRLIHDFSLKSPNHIKIDVDGIEDKIIEGMKQTLNQATLKSLLIEINRKERKDMDIIELIRSCGFTDDNLFNTLSNHSRYRRSGTASELAENIIFVRSTNH